MNSALHTIEPVAWALACATSRQTHKLRPVPLSPSFFVLRDELWGRQSCLQPAFEPAPSWTSNPDQPAGKPAAAKTGCPTLRLCRSVIPMLLASAAFAQPPPASQLDTRDLVRK